MSKPLTVLITGAGAPGIAGTLYCVRENPERRSVRTVVTDIQPQPVGRYLADEFAQLPPPESEPYLSALLDVCHRYQVDVVVPQTTREIAQLVRLRPEIEAADVALVAPPLTAVEIGNNKYSLLNAMAQVAELRPWVPPFRLTRSAAELHAAAVEFGYPSAPVVVKPCVSNGMRGFRVLRPQAWDLARFLAEKPNGEEISLDSLLEICSRGAAWPELLVTEYLPGVEYSVDAFVGAGMQVAVPRLRRVIRSGISFDIQIEPRPDLIAATLAIAKELGLGSVFGLQFKLAADGHPKILECNPRVQGTMVASLFAGVNIIWLGICEALGQPVTGTIERLEPAEFVRYWGGVGVVRGEAHVL